MAAPHYRAPLHSMRFALAALGNLDTTLEHPDFDGISAELIDAVLEEGGKFAGQVLSPLNRVGDRNPAKLVDGRVVTPRGFKEAYRSFAENGWNGAGSPMAMGGQGMPHAATNLLSEMWHGANMAFGLCPMLTQSAIELLLAHGTVEQRMRILPRLVSGEWTGTMCMTEPQAGSDVGAITTRAVRDGAGWKITGSKIYITYGEHDFADNIIHIVLARIEGAPPGSKGLSLFIVPKMLLDNAGEPTGEANAVTCVSLEEKLGLHASPTCVLQFDSASATLLGEPQGGIKAMFTMMNAARIAVGVQGLGVLNTALQLAEAYVQERVQGRDDNGPVPIHRHPDIQRQLLILQGHDLALRLMSVYIGACMDGAARGDARSQQRVDLLTPVIKAHATDVAFAQCSAALQIHGGLGYIEEAGIAQPLRDVRVAMIYEGTNGIQAQDLILRKLAMQEGALMKDLVTDLWETGIALQQSASPLLKRLCNPLLDASKHLEVATIWALQQHASGEEKARRCLLLEADDYLRLVGLAVEGWLLGRAARLAVADERYHSYLPRIGFFMHHVLPETKELSQRIIHAEAVVEWLPRQ